VIDEYRIQNAGVVMIDCDLYRSAVECLQFCDRLIGDHAVLCFDDWLPLAERNMGEKRAFDEFLSARPHFHAHSVDSYSPSSRTFVMSRVQRSHAQSGAA
jgi:hypothetical protein